MESHKRKRKPKSIPAMVFLTLISVGFLLFGLVTVVCGFVLNYHNNFKASDGGEELEAFVESEFDYTQYWLGLPFLITGALSMASGMVQKYRSLTIVTFVFLLICVILSLFAMILEGVDWVIWNNQDRRLKALKKDDYTCKPQTQTLIPTEIPGQSCVCKHMEKVETISGIASCSNISRLSGLFGTIVASAVFGIFLSLAGIVIILKSFSWKPRYHFSEYDLRKAGTWHKNEGYANGAAPRIAGGDVY